MVTELYMYLWNSNLDMHTYIHNTLIMHLRIHARTRTHTHTRYRKKFVANAEKLHGCHNEYALSILDANAHQDHYRSSLLPFSLDTLQQRMELQISEW